MCAIAAWAASPADQRPLRAPRLRIGRSDDPKEDQESTEIAHPTQTSSPHLKYPWLYGHWAVASPEIQRLAFIHVNARENYANSL